MIDMREPLCDVELLFSWKSTTVLKWGSYKRQKLKLLYLKVTILKVNFDKDLSSGIRALRKTGYLKTVYQGCETMPVDRYKPTFSWTVWTFRFLVSFAASISPLLDARPNVKRCPWDVRETIHTPAKQRYCEKLTDDRSTSRFAGFDSPKKKSKGAKRFDTPHVGHDQTNIHHK